MGVQDIVGKYGYCEKIVITRSDVDKIRDNSKLFYGKAKTAGM